MNSSSPSSNAGVGGFGSKSINQSKFGSKKHSVTAAGGAGNTTSHSKLSISNNTSHASRS